MFTGLVEAAVPVRSFETRGTGARLVLPSPGEGDLAVEPEAGGWGGAPAGEAWTASLGDRIAVAGVCLTVAELLAPPAGASGPDMAFDLTAETLERTWFARAVEPGLVVNFERPLRVG